MTRVSASGTAWLAFVVTGCLAHATCTAQELSSTLTGLKLGQQTVAFNTPAQLTADIVKHEEWHDPRGTVWLRVAKINGIALTKTTHALVRTSRAALPADQDTSRWLLHGQIKDAFDFGGRTQLSLATTKATPLPAALEGPGTEQSGPTAKDAEIGKQVTLDGTLWSMSGEWWLDSGGEVLLADARGRQRTFPTNWHGHRVTVTGIARKQLRGPLHQGSSTDPHDELQSYLVIFDADVQVRVGNAFAASEDDDGRFRVLYDEQPRLLNGVYKLIPKGPPRRNHFPSQTAAMLFAQRNWPYLRHTIETATPDKLDVIAARMNSANEDIAMRAVYAGVLAALNDARGRDYLRQALTKSGEPDVDAMHVIGAFDLWHEKAPPDCSWTESAILSALRRHPRELMSYSHAAVQLMRIGSKDGARELLALFVAKDNPIAAGSDFFFFKPERRLLRALLDGPPEVVTIDMLRQLSESRARDSSQDDAYHRLIATTLLQRDSVTALDLYLSNITEGFWGMTFRNHAGPKVLAELAERAPKLEDKAKFEAEMVLVHHAPNATEELIAKMGRTSTKPEQLSHICWELGHLKDGSRAAATAARFVTQRVAGSQRRPEIGAYQMRSILRFIGTSSDPEAVKEMIELLDADFSGVANEWLSAKGVLNRIAAQLAEMTGESFGTDAKSWRKWLETQ